MLNGRSRVGVECPTSIRWSPYLSCVAWGTIGSGEMPLVSNVISNADLAGSFRVLRKGVVPTGPFVGDLARHIVPSLMSTGSLYEHCGPGFLAPAIVSPNEGRRLAPVRK
jgi:hypothetical protein